MRTSHRQIRKRILDAKSKITDEEFFSSKAYNGYLTDLAEAATKRYKRPLRVRVVADHDDETVAFTDYHGIYINACNHITWSFPSRLLRSMSLEGLNAHECGHNLFTDERIWHSYFAGLAKGKFYPKMPDGLDSMQKLYAKDILEALTDDTDTVPMQVIMSTAHALSNILEDGYVDARYSYEFPGSPAKGIALNNLRYADTMPEITEMINRKYYDHSIVVNLLIQYVRAHEVNNLSGYTGEFIDKLYEYIPWIDESVYDDDARSRCEAANRILVDLWPMMQRCFDALRDKQKQAQQQAKQSSQQTGKGGSGSGSGQPGSGDDDNDGSQQGQQAVEEDLSSQLPKAAANFTIKTKPVPSNGTFTPNPGQMNAVRAQVERVIAEETSRIAAHLTNGITSSGNGGVDQNSEYEGNDYEHAADDIERLLSSMAEEKVTEELEEELSEELQREANDIRYGNAHRNIHVTVNRMAHVDQNLIDSYNRVAPELLMLSKRLQRSVSSALRDRRQGGKQTGLLIGKRLNQHALYRNDGRIFYNSRLPTEPINLSVGLLIDESGSMCSNDRITRARATAIVIQDFCESLGIPLLVVGHTAWSSHVELFSYSDFDTYDTAGYDILTGKRIQKGVFAKTRKECAAKLARAIQQDTGPYYRKGKGYDSQPLSTWIRLWFDSYTKPNLRPSSADGYRSMIENHIIPVLGHIQLSKLSSIQIQRFYNDLHTQGRLDNHGNRKYEPLSASTVKHIHAVLSGALKQAVKERIIPFNPCDNCKIPKREKKEMHVLPQDKIGAYLDEAKRLGVYALFYLELTSGLRRGELLGLEWADLNPETRMLTVNKQLTRSGGELCISVPKTENSIRTIALPENTVAVLIDEHNKHPDSPLMFWCPRTNGYWSPDSLRHLHKQMLAAAGVDESVRFHDLRHTFSTLAIQSGVDAKTVAGMLGHYSAAFTLDTYTHVTEQMKRGAAEKIGVFMNASVNVQVNVVHSPSAVVRGDYESDLANCLNPSNSTDLDPTSQ